MTGETIIDVLRKARELIARPEGWTKRANARDARGGIVGVGSGRATCFCAVGALWHADAPNFHSVRALRDALESVLPAGVAIEIEAFNDDPGTTHADVLALFDRAIAAEEART